MVVWFIMAYLLVWCFCYSVAFAYVIITVVSITLLHQFKIFAFPVCLHCPVLVLVFEGAECSFIIKDPVMQQTCKITLQVILTNIRTDYFSPNPC